MARQSRAPTILLTRPLLQSQRFAAQLRARWPDLAVVISPLMAPEFLPVDLPRRAFAALILTSETGAEAARRISAAGQGLPAIVFCVGDRTAQAAKAAGFVAQSAGGDADALVALIARQAPDGPLLFLRGQDSAGDVESRLVSAGTETVSAIVYTQTEHALTRDANRLLRASAPVILPLFSPRSARLFLSQRPDGPVKAPLWLAALSPAVAQVAAGLAPDRMGIAATPDAAAMLQAISALLDGRIGS